MQYGRRAARMTMDRAQDIAARALLFIAEDASRLGRFLAVTGLDPETLRCQARSPEMTGAALAHVMEDESTLLAFSANCSVPPEDLGAAIRMLGVSSPWDST
ncbi:MAG: DUF3572 domain-containing protein [Hyphomicrobiaceae bacterium]|nr:DUF3572 domain-containing protein [Hyphomicrobiaceae bacterium]